MMLPPQCAASTKQADEQRPVQPASSGWANFFCRLYLPNVRGMFLIRSTRRLVNLLLHIASCASRAENSHQCRAPVLSTAAPACAAPRYPTPHPASYVAHVTARIHFLQTITHYDYSKKIISSFSGSAVQPCFQRSRYFFISAPQSIAPCMVKCYLFFAEISSQPAITRRQLMDNAVLLRPFGWRIEDSVLGSVWDGWMNWWRRMLTAADRF